MNIDRLFSDPAMTVLRQSLKASGMTQEVIAHNLANVETPGFKRSEVVFQDKLAAALEAMRGADGSLKGTRTNASHIPIGDVPAPGSVEPRAVVRAETSLRPDGNNVDVESEMVKLSQNTLLYQALTQLVSSKMGQLRTAITEGRR